MAERRARTLDLVTIAIASLAGVGFLALATSEYPSEQSEVGVQLVIGAGAAVALWWRRRWPVQVAMLMIPLAIVSTVAWVIGLVAIAGVADARRLRIAAPLAAAFFAPTLATTALWPTDGTSYLETIVILGACVAVALAIGVALRARHQLAADRLTALERQHFAQLAEARRSERARIAREMHDVLGHRLSILAMHAGALAHRTDVAEGEAGTAAAVVADQARRALRDLGAVVNVLRDDDAEQTGRPQPGLGQVADLVAESGRAGMHVRFNMSADPAILDPDRGRHAYRIVQEALTNARKHAPGMPVSLDIRASSATGVTIDVRNRTVREAPVPATLTVLHERADLSGGSVEHGVVDGEFRVIARLPVAP
jgi:signal transduction histidine kinase